MKRGFALFLCVFLLAGLSACGGDGQEAKEYTYEIAMITPSAEKSIDDGAAVETVWEGIRAFAEENDKTYKYYEPADKSQEAGMEAVEDASAAGASVICGWGGDTAAVFEKAAKEHTDLTFILIDGQADGAARASLDDASAGYFAGYAAVTEGYEDIGFLGDSQADSAFGYGFVQGANAAAVEWGHAVSLRYACGEEESAAARAGETAAQWYEEGTELIAVSGGGLSEPVKAAAEESGGKVIGSAAEKLDETLVAASVKDYGMAVQDMLKAYFTNGKAESVELGVEEKAVSFKWNEEQFSLFVQEDYDKLLERFSEGEIELLSEKDVKSVRGLISQGNLYRISLA